MYTQVKEVQANFVHLMVLFKSVHMPLQTFLNYQHLFYLKTVVEDEIACKGVSLKLWMYLQ